MFRRVFRFRDDIALHLRSHTSLRVLGISAGPKLFGKTFLHLRIVESCLSDIAFHLAAFLSVVIGGLYLLLLYLNIAGLPFFNIIILVLNHLDTRGNRQCCSFFRLVIVTVRHMLIIELVFFNVFDIDSFSGE